MSGILATAQTAAPAPAKAPWVPDRGDGTYQNPILHADYSDPDVCRVGADYYLISSSFSNVPGLPVLHSRDLVNWTIIGHAAARLPERFDKPQHGGGIWAPSIRYHDGWFWIFVGDPDWGILMTKAQNPAGPWTPLRAVQEGKGLIDTCPLWDDDGKAYLVHAFAKSRAGRSDILVVQEMAPDGTKLIGEEKLVYDGRNGVAPTIEGPKFYKRDGWYWIFAPAGGVTGGWQLAMRSKSPFGPYEAKKALEQGSTKINGPHQGGLIDTPDGKQDWFVHFQDRGPFGRIVHLQPVEWDDGWPKMGIDADGNGIGEPVTRHAKPATGAAQEIAAPQTSDEFSSTTLGLQWQWESNPNDKWFSLSARPGWLRMNASPIPDGSDDLWNDGAVLGQKFPAPAFTATVAMEFAPDASGDQAGLAILGQTHASLNVSRADGKTFKIEQVIVGPGGAANGRANGEGRGAGSYTPVKHEDATVPAGPIWLQVHVDEQAMCTFGYSTDGKTFTKIGNPFRAGVGRWIGARVGLFCIASGAAESKGHADFDWIRIE